MSKEISKKQAKDLLHTLVEKNAVLIYGGNIRWDVNDHFKCVAENWMRGNFDERVEEWWPMKNIFLIVELENDAGVDDQDIAKSIIEMPCPLDIFIWGHSKRLMNKVVREVDGFYSKRIFYAETDSSYIHEKHWSALVDNRVAGKSLGPV